MPATDERPYNIGADLETLLSKSQELICLAGTDGYFKWLNPRWSELLGVPLEELYQRPFVEFVHPADIEATFREVGRLAEGEETVLFENRYRCADGSWLWLSWNTTSREDGTLFCIARDITAQRAERWDQRRRLRQLELAERLLKVGNWCVDLVGETVYWSPEVFRIHGRDPDTFTPSLDQGIEAYHPEDRAEVSRCLEEAIASRGEFRFRLRLIRADDKAVRVVLSSGVVQVNDAGDPVEIVGVFQDITELAEAEQGLREVNESLRQQMLALEIRSEMMDWISELGDMLQSAQDLEEARDVLGALMPRIFAGLSGVVYLSNEQRLTQEPITSWGALGGAWRAADPASCWAARRGTTHVVNKTGELRCRHLSGVPAGSRCISLMAHGQLVGLLVLASNDAEDYRLDTHGALGSMVAEQIALAVSNMRLRDRLRQQSLRDQLTDLYNRRFFDSWLSKQLSQARRSGTSISAAIIDIDHFKKFNDTFGHLTADQVLVKFASVLKDCVRDEDVVCRWGGEEFLLAMPGADTEAVEGICKRIQESLARVVVRDDEGVQISPPTFSAGVACFPEHARSLEGLLRCADRALYQAKQGGRDRVVVASLSPVEEDEAAA